MESLSDVLSNTTASPTTGQVSKDQLEQLLQFVSTPPPPSQVRVAANALFGTSKKIMSNEARVMGYPSLFGRHALNIPDLLLSFQIIALVKTCLKPFIIIGKFFACTNCFFYMFNSLIHIRTININHT